MTTSDPDARMVGRLLWPAGILNYRAETLEQADILLEMTGAAVLLSDTLFPHGTWRSALDLVARKHPSVALVVAAPPHLEQFWMDMIDPRVCDIVQRPFSASELRRVIRFARPLGESQYVPVARTVR